MKTINADTLYYLDNGQLIDMYEFFGAHLVRKKGKVTATRFTLYAPNAEHVKVFGDFNDYDEFAHPLKRIDDKGVYSITINQDLRRATYKYVIETKNGEKLYKTDPFAFYNSHRPETMSIVSDRTLYEWQDADYMRTRHEKAPYENPMNIYELHVGTWMQRPDGSFHTFADLVDHLIPYLNENHFTHVELMPVIEHPFDGSWGYQGLGYFAVTSRYGTVDDFKYFVDRCHQNGIQVLLDWVPGHFCKDAHGLYRFDGTPLFEYGDPEIGENPEWGTANFDLGKGFTRSFLISSALFFMKEFHLDGFRIDAVSYMLYYHGNPEKGENHGAQEFLKSLSYQVFATFKHALLVAEDSSAYPHVTKPTDAGGLGFNYKWNMGWMNDTLKYFSKDPIYRKYHHDLLTFSLMYAFSENYVLPFSHDEVVHGKKSLVDKMPGDYWQKFANYRALIGYLHTHPGKSLLFMGQEFAQMHEWKDYTELDWHLLSYPMHDSALRFNREMNRLSKSEPALYEKDHDPAGFEWIDADNAEKSVISFIRRGHDPDTHLIVVINLTPEVHHHFPLGVPAKGRYEEIINSDYASFGGSDLYNGLPLHTKDAPYKHFEQQIEMLLAPLSISILKWVKNHD